MKTKCNERMSKKLVVFGILKCSKFLNCSKKWSLIIVFCSDQKLSVLVSWAGLLPMWPWCEATYKSIVSLANNLFVDPISLRTWSGHWHLSISSPKHFHLVSARFLSTHWNQIITWPHPSTIQLTKTFQWISLWVESKCHMELALPTCALSRLQRPSLKKVTHFY